MQAFGDIADALMYTPAMGRPRGSKNKYSGRDRFPTCYDVDEQTGCWNWTKSKGSHGYGDFRRDGHKLAHRWSYATFVAPIPSGAFVLHRCDNHGCVNPAHLFVGTPGDNIQDMIEKGRHYSKGKTFEEVFGSREAARLKANLRDWAVANPPPPEARKRQGAKIKGRKRSAEIVAAQSERMVLWWQERKKNPELMRLTDEQRAVHSERMKLWWQNRKGR